MASSLPPAPLALHPKTRRRLAVTAIMLAIFLAAMEATIVGTAMPTIVRELGGLELYGWVAAAYLLASTIMVPLYGKLSDLYGRRPVLLFGLAVFFAGSIGCGLAPTIHVLIAARVVQGVGAGAIQPVSMTIIGDLFTIQERTKIQGAFGAIWGVAGVCGPLLGALIVSTIGWKWVFWINLPIIVAAAGLIARAYFDVEGDDKKRPSLDVAGAVLIGLVATAVLAGAGARSFSTMGPLLVAATIGLVGFWFVEKRAAEPVIPPKLVSNRNVGSALASSTLLGAAMGASLNYIPLYVQGVLGGSPAAAGGAITPMLLGWPIAATATGRLLPRLGARTPVVIGSTLCVIATLMLSLNGSATAPSMTALYVAIFAFGLGMGFTTTALIVALQSSVGYRERGVVTALTVFGRLLGSALGAGALGAVLVRSLTAHLDAARVATLLNPEARRAGLALDTEALHALSTSFVPVWWAVFGFATVNLGVVVVLYRATIAAPESIPPPPLTAPPDP